MRDPLATLLRIREASLDEAKRQVAERLAGSEAAARRLADAEAALARETETAVDLGGDDARVDAFARWLPTGRKAIEVARGSVQAALAELDQARTVLTLSRAAHRAVELLMAQHREQADLEAGRKLQRDSDDLALQPRSA